MRVIYTESLLLSPAARSFGFAARNLRLKKDHSTDVADRLAKPAPPSNDSGAKGEQESE
jgi:hypothetical protein